MRIVAVAVAVVASVVSVGSGCERGGRPGTPAVDAVVEPDDAVAAPAVGAFWFEENTGRFNPRVRFVAHGKNGAVFVEDGAFVVVDNDGVGARFVTGGGAAVGSGALPLVVRRYARDRSFEARAFGEVSLPVSDGVDVVLYGKGGELEYDWRFAPGVRATPSLGVTGVFGEDVDVGVEGGDVVVERGGKGVRLLAPHTVAVDAAGSSSVVASAMRVVRDGNGARVVVDVGAHDEHARLVVDPVIRFLGSVGGTGNEMRGNPFFFDAPGLGVDGSDNLYVSGTTTSTDLPVDGATFQDKNLSGSDAFVAAVAADGVKLRWITYVATGGIGGDEIRPLTVDAGDSEVLLAVRCDGVSFPTLGGFQQRGGGGVDVGIARFGNDGRLRVSTLFGGAESEFPYAITVDRTNSNVVVGGMTTGPTLTTPGALQPDARGTDGFVAVFSRDLTTLVGATHVGSTGTDLVLGLRAGGGRIVITGQVDGDDLLGRGLAPKGRDAFVASVTDDVRGGFFAVLLGSELGDRGFGVDVAEDGSIYVVGATEDADSFTRVGTQPPTGRGGLDGFAALLTGDGAIERSVIFGGTGEDFLGAVKVTADGRVIVGGSTKGTTGFFLPNGCDSNGNEQGIIGELDVDLTPHSVALLAPAVRNLALRANGDAAFVGESGAPITQTNGSVRGAGAVDVFVGVVDFSNNTKELDCIVGGGAGGGNPDDVDGDFISVAVDADDRDACVPSNRARACKDLDNDGLGAVEEEQVTRSDPLIADTNGDGVDDLHEAYANTIWALKCANGGDVDNSAPCVLSFVDPNVGVVDSGIVNVDGVKIAVDGLAISRDRELFAFSHEAGRSSLVQIDRLTGSARVIGAGFSGNVSGAAFLGRGGNYDRPANVITVVITDRATGSVALGDVDIATGALLQSSIVDGVGAQESKVSPYDIAVDPHGEAWLMVAGVGGALSVGVVDVDRARVTLEKDFVYDNGGGDAGGLAFVGEDIGAVVAFDSIESDDIDVIDVCRGVRRNVASDVGTGAPAGNTDLARVPPTASSLAFDSDGDGVLNAFEHPGASICADTDGDGAIDALDADADGDGLNDGDEDRNGNGVVDVGESDPRDRCDPVACSGGAVDVDGDLISAFADPDDGDACIPNGVASACKDIDGDGLGGAEEGDRTATNAEVADSDGNGVDDLHDAYAQTVWAVKCAAQGDFATATPCALSLVDPKLGLVDVGVISIDGVDAAVDGLAIDANRGLFGFAHIGAKSALVRIDRMTAAARVVGNAVDGFVTGAAFLGRGVAYDRADNIVTVVVGDRVSGTVAVGDVDTTTGLLVDKLHTVDGLREQDFVAAPFDIAADTHGEAWLLGSDAGGDAVLGVLDVNNARVRLEAPFKYDNGGGAPGGIAFDVDNIGVVTAFEGNGTDDIDRLDLCGGTRSGVVADVFKDFNAGNTDLAKVPTLLNPALVDDDGDGVPTALEHTTNRVCNDTDSDGLIDAEDADADNDGLGDGEEDRNRNGVIDLGESDPRNRCDPVACGGGNPDADGDCIDDVVAGRTVNSGAVIFVANSNEIRAFDPDAVDSAALLTCHSANTSGIAVDELGGVIFVGIDASPVIEAHDVRSLARVPSLDLVSPDVGGALAIDGGGRVLYRIERNALVAISIDFRTYGQLLDVVDLVGTPLGNSGSIGIADGHALAVDVDAGVLYVAENEHVGGPVLAVPLLTSRRTQLVPTVIDGVSVGLTGGIGVLNRQLVVQSTTELQSAAVFDAGGTRVDTVATRLSNRAFSDTNLSFSVFRDSADELRLVEVDGLTDEVWVTRAGQTPVLHRGASGAGFFAVGHVDGNVAVLDRDHDQLNDINEFFGGTDPDDADSDDDGFVDGVDNNNANPCVPSAASVACDADGDSVFGEALIDTDGDTIFDPFDPDDDNDGIATIDEVFADQDGDGIVGYLDPSERGSVVCGDGVADCSVEACDDGNDVDGDGCSSLCTRDGTMTFTFVSGDPTSCAAWAPGGLPVATDDVVFDASSADFVSAGLSAHRVFVDPGFVGSIDLDSAVIEDLDVGGGRFDVNTLNAIDVRVTAAAQASIGDLFVDGGSIDVAAGGGATSRSVASAVVNNLIVNVGLVSLERELVLGGSVYVGFGALRGSLVFSSPGAHELFGEGNDQSTYAHVIVRGDATVRPVNDLTIEAVDVEGGVFVLSNATDVRIGAAHVSGGVFAPNDEISLGSLEVTGGVFVAGDELQIRDRLVVDGGRYLSGAFVRLGGGDATDVDINGTLLLTGVVQVNGGALTFSDRTDLRVTGSLEATSTTLQGDGNGGQWSLLVDDSALSDVSVRDSLNRDLVPLLPDGFTDLGNNTRWGPQLSPTACGALRGVAGDVVLATDDDVAAFNASGVACIDGDLIIGADVTAVTLPNLVTVTGSFRVRGTQATVIDVPLLTSAGSVDVGDNDALTTIDLPALVSVDEDFVVDDNDALVTIAIPVVAAIGGDLVVSGNADLDVFDAPALQNVGADLIIDDNDSLDEVGLLLVVNVGGTLHLVGNDALVALLLPLLENVSGDVVVRENVALESVSAPAIEHIGGNLEFVDNDGLVEIALPSLPGVGGVLEIDNDLFVLPDPCGNGDLDDGEACDDGNADVSDGCSACIVDDGFVCAGAPSVCRSDVDGDGLADEDDACARVADDGSDVDGDAVGDACDSDDDNGGGAAVVEGDSDNDGVADDDDNCVDVRNNDQGDVDGDGTGDACDDDPDGDGDNDPCPLLADVSACAFDEDGDGLDDEDDPCPVTAGDDQDLDDDGIGDACDADDDGDGVNDDDDVCAAIADDQSDSDDDGRGDACDRCPTVAGPRGGCPSEGPEPAPIDEPNPPAPTGCATTSASPMMLPLLGLLLLLRRRRAVLAACVVVVATQAQAATWLGAVSSDSNDGANWSGGVVPSDFIVVPAGSPTLDVTADLRVSSFDVDGVVTGSASVSVDALVCRGACDIAAPVIIGPTGIAQVDGVVDHVTLNDGSVHSLTVDGVVHLLELPQASSEPVGSVTGAGAIDTIDARSGVVLWNMSAAQFTQLSLGDAFVIFDGHDVVTAGLDSSGVISGAASLTVRGTGAVTLGVLADAPTLTLAPTGGPIDLAAADLDVSAFIVDSANAVVTFNADVRVRVRDTLRLRGDTGARARLAPSTAGAVLSIDPPDVDAGGVIDVDHVALGGLVVERGVFIDPADFEDAGGNRGFGPPPALCGDRPSFAGTVDLESDSDVVAFEDSGIECIDGDLIFGRDVRDIVLTHLSRVTGTITIKDGVVEQVSLTALTDAGGVDVSGNTNLSNLALPALVSVAGNFVVADNDALEVVDVDVLADVGGDFAVTGNDDLAALPLGSLASVGGDLVFSDNDSLGAVDAPVLASVGGDLVVEGNDGLAAVSLAGLSVVDGDVRALGNAQLQTMSFASLDDIGGDLVFIGNSALATVVLELLQNVGGDVVAIDNDTLTALLVQALETVGGNVVITGNAALAGVSLDSVTAVGGDLIIDENADVADVNLDSLASVGGVLTLDDDEPVFPPGTTCGGGGVCHPICGDGVVLDGESCDDGDAVSGDGCSSACVVEGFFVCAGAPSVCEVDSDGDGRINRLDRCPSARDDGTDTDADRVPDACDHDDDGDGKFDDDDGCVLVADADARDDDGDGVDDCGVVDGDRDGDGNADEVDLCPDNADVENRGFACGEDDDQDGIADEDDACPLIAGVVCDANDLDGDGVEDDRDLCPTIEDDGSDDDGDGLGSACDSDDDGDGVPDGVDECPDVANADLADTDEDGVPDACDRCAGVDDRVADDDCALKDDVAEAGGCGCNSGSSSSAFGAVLMLVALRRRRQR